MQIEPEEEEFDPDAFGEGEARAALEAGIRLFNGGRYREAHEEFEKGWLASQGAEADFHKGLVQLSICLHHALQGDPEGSRRLYRGHRALLAPLLPRHAGLDLERLLTDAQRFLEPLLRARPGEDFEFTTAPPRIQTATE